MAEKRATENQRRARLLLTAALAVYGIPCLLRPDAGRMLDAVDLAIHETGHLVFAPFGELLQFLGGTLLQLALPIAFVVYFWRRADRHAASVALWWVAQNCWNISVYVRDARSQELPLVGGGEHDWAYLLGRFGWLHYDHALALDIRVVGVAIYLYAVALGVREGMRRTDPVSAGAADSPYGSALSSSKLHPGGELRRRGTRNLNSKP